MAELNHQWEEFKEHFVVEHLPIVGSLKDVTNWYFAVEPPFTERKPKEFPDAFILSALEYYHQEHKANIAVISADSDFSKACARRHYIAYFGNLEKYAEAFKPALSSEDLIEEPIDPTVPIVTEDLTELKAILGRGDSVTSIEVNRALQLIRSHGENYRYFFQNNGDPLWLDPLISARYFKDPPNLVFLAPERIQYPFWPEIEYLKKVCKKAPEEAIQLVLDIPVVDNPRVYQYIIDIALELVGVQSVKLKSKVLEYANLEYHLHPVKFPDLLAHWIGDGQTEAALELAQILVQFVPDPNDSEKRKKYREIDKKSIPVDENQVTLLMSVLEPVPRFNSIYSDVLGRGVRPLAEKEPYNVARMLLDATVKMIRLSKHQDHLESGTSADLLELWCPRLNEPRSDYPDSRESLVHTLTFACEKVYERSSESIEILDNALRNQRWDIFDRLRPHLYALHPSDQTLPWIREYILAHVDYGRLRYGYEFQQMVRLACEHFGTELLTREERTRIFDAILRGPSSQDFRLLMGDEFTEKTFEQWRRKFHRKQLRPFAQLLFGKYSDYFQDLEGDETEDEITDESYSRSRKSEGGMVTSRSPKSPQELAALSDVQLLEYINEWQDEHRPSDDWLTDINIEALADAFQVVFKESVIPQVDRLDFWMSNRENIHRPIYVSAILNAVRDRVKEGKFDELERWFEFSEWVLTHPDPEHEDPYGNAQLRDRSSELPSWHTARRAVCDFTEDCLEQDVGLPFYARTHLASVLGLLCTQYDWLLDQDVQALLNRDDLLTEAINTTRGRALENLVKFGFWVRRHDGKTEIAEISEILEKRFTPDVDFPLTLPEYAILGRIYQSIFDLDKLWASDRKSILFPQHDTPAWLEAFGSFVRYSRPNRAIYDAVRTEFEFALSHLDGLRNQEGFVRGLTDSVGQHLFTYYVWDVYPLEGADSLLDHFYRTTDNDREHWATLFNHVGHSLRNTGKHLERGIDDRIVAFFEWRLSAEEPLELREFADWIDAECLDSEWRLNAFLRVLQIDDILNESVTPFDDQGDSAATWLPMDTTQALRAMIPDNTPLVLKCFAKLTDVASRSSIIYIPNEDARAILKAGFNHDNEGVRKDAERARENLLRNGLFGILD